MADGQETAFFIGDVALDDYYSAERWPGLADKAYIRESKSYVGGMIANAASVHAGLGGRTEFISLLNHSDLSRRLCDELNRLDVATTHMLYDADTANSHNMIFLVGGEHVVLIGETGNAPMQLPAPTLEALRKPGYLYTTISRSKRLRGAGLAGAELLADLRAHGRNAGRRGISARRRRRHHERDRFWPRLRHHRAGGNQRLDARARGPCRHPHLGRGRRRGL
jgi:ribokinase